MRTIKPSIFQIFWSQTNLCVIKQSERNISEWIRKFSWFYSRIRLISFTLAMAFNAREYSQKIIHKKHHVIWTRMVFLERLFWGGAWQVINERELRDDYFAFQQKETIAQGFGIILKQTENCHVTTTSKPCSIFLEWILSEELLHMEMCTHLLSCSDVTVITHHLFHLSAW